MYLTYFDRVKFKELRIKQNMNQYELAEEIGTFQFVISKIESGNHKSPSFCLIYRATKVLKCTMEDLVKEEAKFKFDL